MMTEFITYLNLGITLLLLFVIIYIEQQLKERLKYNRDKLNELATKQSRDQANVEQTLRTLHGGVAILHDRNTTLNTDALVYVNDISEVKRVPGGIHGLLLVGKTGLLYRWEYIDKAKTYGYCPFYRINGPYNSLSDNLYFISDESGNLRLIGEREYAFTLRNYSRGHHDNRNVFTLYGQSNLSEFMSIISWYDVNPVGDREDLFKAPPLQSELIKMPVAAPEQYMPHSSAVHERVVDTPSYNESSSSSSYDSSSCSSSSCSGSCD